MNGDDELDPATCPWCVSARQFGSPAPDHTPHSGWKRELDHWRTETGRATTARLAARKAAWDAVAAVAAERGACLTCLRASHWEVAPRYVRHRTPRHPRKVITT